MPIAKSLATGNEAYYMTNNTYANSPTELDVAGQTSYPDGATINLVNDTNEDMSYVIATRPTLMPNNKHIVFQKHSGKFADVTLCEATSDAQATWLCRDALHGQVVPGNSLSGTGWTSYVISGDATGSSFATALEQKAQSIMANNPNYVVASIDEQSGTVKMCDINNSTVGANGECVATKYAGNCDETNRFNYSTTCNPYEVTYDASGKVVSKTSCTGYNTSKGACGWWQYIEEDGNGQLDYYVDTYCTSWTGNTCSEVGNNVAFRAVYEDGVYLGYDGIFPGGLYERVAAGSSYDSGGTQCINGVDWENATCLPE